MTLRAGELRERVTLQSPPATDDGAGGQIGGWSKVATLWAKVEALGGAEAMLAGIETGLTRYRVIIRPRAIATGQRLLWGAQALDIRAVLPATTRDRLVLLCEGLAA